MAYQRKTRDEFIVEGYFSDEYEWEEVTAEDTKKEIRERLKEYRANDPKHDYRWRVRRVRIQNNEG
jgi:hypothetical protein